ncbi:MAG: glycoside hydrolase family 140 protein [Muribaculaceae bacterium]|nr:glycoside hydrolase family 140 protein [Muribaculaceae bacterium]
MRFRIINRVAVAILLIISQMSISLYAKQSDDHPWKNGRLTVSPEGRYLMHENGTPFFWLGDTGWLMPQRLDRDEVEFYISRCGEAGFNVIQIQTLNAVPSINTYGQYSMTDGFDFSDIDKPGVYGYWDHLDHIIKTAENHGIYIGMVCIWGGLVKSGKMNEEQAADYGRFLARRYKDAPNIVWIMGGDIRGDVKREVWESLATAIREEDPDHLMTFHPFGRTTSARWFNDADWLDFNMFQSGHRRYGQQKGDGDFTLPRHNEEDNWRYVEYCRQMTPLKPVIDAEPVYEGIPQGLHDPDEARWTAADVRRYAYWSVFAGACGHTYGNNSIMQFYRPGINPAYGASQPWWEALDNPGFNQMKHLKALIMKFPYFERVPDQSVIAGDNGERYDYAVATRGKDYLLVYNHTGRPMEIDLTKITGKKKKAWWFNPQNGEYMFIGEFDNAKTMFVPDVPYGRGEDRVLVATDSESSYI